MAVVRNLATTSCVVKSTHREKNGTLLAANISAMAGSCGSRLSESTHSNEAITLNSLAAMNFARPRLESSARKAGTPVTCHGVAVRRQAVEVKRPHFNFCHHEHSFSSTPAADSPSTDFERGTGRASALTIPPRVEVGPPAEQDHLLTIAKSRYWHSMPTPFIEIHPAASFVERSSRLTGRERIPNAAITGSSVGRASESADVNPSTPTTIALCKACKPTGNQKPMLKNVCCGISPRKDPQTHGRGRLNKHIHDHGPRKTQPRSLSC